MKVLVVYSSQTGFTKSYAYWICERTGGQMLELNEAKKKPESYFNDFDAIIYGSWAIAGKVNNSSWFREKLPSWKGKKLALFCVGASYVDDNEDIKILMDNSLTPEEKKYAKSFYCQGGINYEKMNFINKGLLKVFATVLKNKKNKTGQDEAMAKALEKSYDISDKKFIEPILDYIDFK